MYGYSQVYTLTGDKQWLDVAERNADLKAVKEQADKKLREMFATWREGLK